MYKLAVPPEAIAGHSGRPKTALLGENYLEKDVTAYLLDDVSGWLGRNYDRCLGEVT